MFRAYQPARPSSNLYLKQKWDLIDYETHRRNVREVKAKIDQTAPRAHMHMYIKPKLLQNEIERLCTIHRENRILMDRIATIQRTGGWTDCRNYYESKSMNTTRRQKSMVELCYGNQTMLGRIRDTHTSYNRSKFEEDYQLQLKYKAIISKYPRNWTEMAKKMTKYRAFIRNRYVYKKFPAEKVAKIEKFEKKPIPEEGTSETKVKEASTGTKKKHHGFGVKALVKHIYSIDKRKKKVTDRAEPSKTTTEPESVKISKAPALQRRKPPQKPPLAEKPARPLTKKEPIKPVLKTLRPKQIQTKPEPPRDIKAFDSKTRGRDTNIVRRAPRKYVKIKMEKGREDLTSAHPSGTVEGKNAPQGISTAKYRRGGMLDHSSQLQGILKGPDERIQESAESNPPENTQERRISFSIDDEQSDREEIILREAKDQSNVEATSEGLNDEDKEKRS